MSYEIMNLKTNIKDPRDTHFEQMNGNNGLAHSLNPAPIWVSNFAHRSSAEAQITMALERYRRKEKHYFIFMPLPVFSIPGLKRREIDFLIIDKGIALWLEIDGDSHLGELALDRDKKDKWLHRNHLHSLRFSSIETSDEVWAEKCVSETFEYIEELRKLR